MGANLSPPSNAKTKQTKNINPMPKPVNQATETVANPFDLTHKVKLENGKTFTLVDKQRPQGAWKFTEGVWTNVPRHVAERLKSKATDNVTMKTGQKTSAQIAQKFSIELLASPLPAE